MKEIFILCFYSLKFHSPLNPLQYGFEPHHSTRTALTRVIGSICPNSIKIHSLLNLLTAFKTTDHCLLLEALCVLGFHYHFSLLPFCHSFYYFLDCLASTLFSVHSLNKGFLFIVCLPCYRVRCLISVFQTFNMCLTYSRWSPNICWIARRMNKYGFIILLEVWLNLWI